MELLVLDLETDDLKPERGAIVEIGAVVLDTETYAITPVFDKRITEKGHELDEQAWIFSNSTLTVEEVKKGEDLASIKPELQGLLDKYPTISYNGPGFDFKFLTTKGFQIKRPAPDPMFILTDILKLQGRSFGGFKWPKVQEALNFYKIVETEPHRALGDATLEAKIVAEMIKLKQYDLKSSVFDAITSEDRDAANRQRYKAKIKYFDAVLSCLTGIDTILSLGIADTPTIETKAVDESKTHLVEFINKKREFCFNKLQNTTEKIT